MKSLFLILFCLFLFCCSEAAFAEDIDLQWQQADRADGYKVQISEDNGNTWVEISGFTVTLFSLQDVDTQIITNMAKTTITVADNKLILVRIGAFNNAGTTWRLEAGIFYNTLWKPLNPPSGIGIK